MSALQALSDSKGVAARRLNFEKASALTFDPIQQSPSLLREAARSIGFRRVLGFSRLGQIVENLPEADFEVLVLDADAQRDEVFDVVRDIRHGNVGGNPFVAIVVTAYGICASDVSNMLNAGMDTVLVKPFSVDDLYKRLATIVKARKRFVATPTYIGPDRRDESKSGGEAIPLLDVPNTLANGVLSLNEDCGPQIARAKHALATQRVQRLGAEMQRRIAVLAEAADPAAERPKVAAALQESLAVVATSVKRDGSVNLAEMLGAARQVIEELAANGSDETAMAVVQTGGQLSRMDPPD